MTHDFPGKDAGTPPVSRRCRRHRLHLLRSRRRRHHHRRHRRRRRHRLVRSPRGRSAPSGRRSEKTSGRPTERGWRVADGLKNCHRRLRSCVQCQWSIL